MIRVLVVDDSPVVSMLLRALIENEPDMVVVGQAKNGREAITMVERYKPDLVTMDIRMPEMDGFEATKVIMASNPTPIIIVSSTVNAEDFQAMKAGALTLIEKPQGYGQESFKLVRRDLINSIRELSKVDVQLVEHENNEPASGSSTITEKTRVSFERRDIDIVAIGVSTGGPTALLELLKKFPKDFPAPIIISQHISQGFVDGLVGWLNDQIPLEVKLCQQGELLKAGVAYFSPDDHHFEVRKFGNDIQAKLTQSEPVNRFRPSASVSLNSVAQVCKEKAIGIILTGMGRDGADGLLAMRHAGALTFAQDEASCTVFGMPAEAIAIGAAEQVANLEEMSEYIRKVAK